MNALNQMIAQGGRPIQIESPLNQMVQFEQIRGGQQANMLRQQQMADSQREREQLQTVNRLYSEAYDPATGRVDESRLYGGLAESGFGSQIPGLQEQYSKERKATAEAKTAQLKFERDKLGAILNAASSAVDQPSYDIARSNLQRLGIDVSSIPEVYDPKYVQQASREAMDVKQRVDVTLAETERQDKQNKTAYSNYVRANVLKNPDAPILSEEEFLAQRAQPPATIPSTMGNRAITPFGGIEAVPSPVSARASANAQMPAGQPTVAADGANVLPNVTVDDPNLIEPAVAALLATGDPRDKELAQMIEKRLVETRKRQELTGDFQNIVVARKQIAQLKKDPTPTNLAIIKDLEQQIKAVNEGKATKVNVGVKLPPQEQEFEKELGSGQAKAILKSKEQAEDAREMLDTVSVGRDILKSGVITGAGADFFVGLNQALKTAGVDFGYADASANSQAYIANMAQNVGKLIKLFGSGTGLSDADRKYAIEMAGGRIALDRKALEKILGIQERASKTVIKRYNKKVQGVKTNIPLEVELDEDVSAPAAAPMTAINPTTGERIQSTDGGKTWSKLRGR